VCKKDRARKKVRRLGEGRNKGTARPWIKYQAPGDMKTKWEWDRKKKEPGIATIKKICVKTREL